MSDGDKTEKIEKIREMEKQDWDRVKKIYQQSIEKGNVTFATQCPTYEEWDKKHLKQARYVYEIDNYVVGYTVISATSERLAYKGVVEVSIFVDKDYLKKGIGYKMLTYLCKKTEEMGVWTLYSAIFSSNIASIQLHKKCGFRMIGYREKIAKDKFGNWQTTVIMERRNAII